MLRGLVTRDISNPPSTHMHTHIPFGQEGTLMGTAFAVVFGYWFTATGAFSGPICRGPACLT